jgi:hypothetical protein
VVEAVYYFDVERWLIEHQAHPLLGGKRRARNMDWYHMLNGDVVSMLDKWEYPWYAAWDLAFHTIALGLGASHQTGWTGAVARLLDFFARTDPAGPMATAERR